MWFDPKTTAGFVILTNYGDPGVEDNASADAYITIGDKLMELATTLP